MWGEGHCSNTMCTLPPNHPGNCNNTTGFHPTVPEVSSVPPSGATRGARQGMQTQGMPTVSEEEELQIDALLGSATTVENEQWLPTPLVFGTTTVVDARR